MISLDLAQIMQSIAQRYPMLMIDRIVELEPARHAAAIKNVTMNERFFSGHFPDQPTMPGTLIIEAMAQTATFLFYNPEDKSKKLDFYLGVVKEARFLKPVLPGDILRITVDTLRITEDTLYAKSEVLVGKDKVSQGELVFARRKR